MKRKILSVVVVAARDAMTTLPEVVARVRAQRVGAQLEVVVVDAGSRDGTRDYAAAHADAVLQADRKAPRAALWNAGLRAAQGEVAVLLSVSAYPADPRWLFHLVAPFSDSRVAAVFARRLPRPGFMATGGVREGRAVRFDSAAAFDALPVEARRSACAFEPACAAISRAAWEAQPFEPLDGAEGEAWARGRLRAGQALVHATAAAVFFGAPARPLAGWVEAARTQRQLARVLGPLPLALPLGLKARELPGPLSALAGGLWARVEARLSRGAAR